MMEAKHFIALDVHTKQTTYVVRTWQGDIALEGKCATLYQDVKTAVEPYLSSAIVGMEACSCFYPLYDGFIQDRIPVKVANVLRIRQLVVKNDTLDAYRLSDMLRLGTFPESFIPPKTIRELRTLLNLRHGFLQETNRIQNKIWADLTREGIHLPTRKLFTQEGLWHLKRIRNPSCSLTCLITHYEYLTTQLLSSTALLKKKAATYFPKEFAALKTLDGIKDLLASYLIAEVCPIHRFANEKKLRRYAGVIPCFQESGGKTYGSTLPKNSSRAHLRWALTMAAHAAKKKKGSAAQIYYQQRKKIVKQKRIMAIAKRISDHVYQKLKHTYLKNLGDESSCPVRVCGAKTPLPESGQPMTYQHGKSPNNGETSNP